MVVRITYDMVNAMQNFLNYERENFIKKKNSIIRLFIIIKQSHTR